MPIIVEGKYDKIKLESLVDGLIICSNGFRIFKDKEKQALIRRLACDSGIILLTDSDVAGFKLRGFIKQSAKDARVVNIYIPQVAGKESRKQAPSKQGLLGVEGMDAELLRKLFLQADVLSDTPQIPTDPITRADFFREGLSGGENASARRQALLTHLGLPCYISTNALLDVINRLMTRDEYLAFVADTNTQV